MSDSLAAKIRTAWPLFLGHIATFAGVFAATKLGFSPELAGLVELAAVEAVSALVSYGVWALGGRLEKQPNPVLAAVGRWLISAGKEIGAPTYGQNPAPLSRSTPDTP